MRVKVYTLSGNVYESAGDFDDIHKFVQLHGSQDTNLYGVATRNMQPDSHRVIIPFSAIESIMEFDDDE